MICESEIHPEDRSRSFVRPADAALKTALFTVEHRGGGNVVHSNGVKIADPGGRA